MQASLPAKDHAAPGKLVQGRGVQGWQKVLGELALPLPRPIPPPSNPYHLHKKLNRLDRSCLRDF